MASEELIELTKKADDGKRQTAEGGADCGVTGRVCVLCIVWGVLFGYCVPFLDLKMGHGLAGIGAGLPTGAVGVLLLSLALNPLLRLLRRAWALSRRELLTVYTCCTFSVLVPGTGGEGNIVQVLIGSFYYATRDNRWLEWLEPYLKPWLTPALDSKGHYSAAGQKLAEAWYIGNGGQVPWSAWLMPLLIWGSYVLAMYFMLGCLATILRAQWTEREALRFPLLQLPLEMTAEERHASFWKNPAMWCGFGAVAFIKLLNGLNGYYADVPRFPLEIGLGPILTENPWNQLGLQTLAVSPLAVGISYLLTSEMSFSLWFFYLFIKAEYLIAYYMGYQPAALPQMGGWWERTFTAYQIIGATFVIVGCALFSAREHLRHVVRRAFGREPAKSSERDEPLSYPIAFWGFIFSFAFLIGWSVLAGAKWPAALTFWIGFLVVAIATARLLAEGGLGAVNWTPLTVMQHFAGSGAGTWMPASSLLPSAMIMQTSSGWMLPSFLYSFKLAVVQKIHMRRLVVLIAIVTVLTLMTATATKVYLGYAYGGLQLNAWHASAIPKIVMWDTVGYSSPTPPAPLTKWFWLGLGGLLTWGMMVARATWSWFPLHPLGLLVASNFGSMAYLWCSVFLGWLSKVGITKFGGTDAYRAAVPLFMGIALGDVAMTLFWTLLNAALSRM